MQPFLFCALSVFPPALYVSVSSFRYIELYGLLLHRFIHNSSFGKKNHYSAANTLIFLPTSARKPTKQSVNEMKFESIDHKTTKLIIVLAPE